MGWLNDWWNSLFSPRKEEPKKIETLNVGEVCVLITYRDCFDKVIKSSGYIYGRAIPWPGGEYLITSAPEVLDNLIEDSVKYGVFRIVNKYIPRERVLEIYTSYKDYWIDAP